MAAGLPSASSPKGEAPFLKFQGQRTKSKEEREKLRLQPWEEYWEDSHLWC